MRRNPADSVTRLPIEVVVGELADTRLLQSISAELIRENDVEALYEKILDAAVAIMRSDFASMQVLDEARNGLRLLAWRGFGPEFGRIFELVGPDTRTSCAVARRTGQRVIVTDVETCDFIVGTPALEDHRRNAIRAAQSTPLMSRGGALVGMISTHWSRPHQPSERDLRLLDILARQAADLLERKKADEALRESEQRNRSLLSLLPAAVYTCEAPSGVITYYNERAAELWGRAPNLGDTDERFCGSYRLYRLDGTFLPHAETPMALAMSEGRSFRNQEVTIERPDGTRIAALVNIDPIRDASSRVVGAINVFTDSTALKQAQEAVRQSEAKERRSRLEAEAANRSKDVFLATLSHEIRTPLSAMLGWATILRKKPCTSEEIREGIEVIERNCRAQVQLIEDVLEVSRIVSGKLRLEIRACDLASTIHAAIEVVRAAADARQIELIADIDAHASFAWCDDVRMQQVIWNLLSNAIKFTSKGGTIRISLDRDDANARIMVSDTGRGISADVLPYVFDRFWQADGTARRRAGGLGLGLSIVKHIVELHGGTVEAKSDGEGCGATFIVQIPMRALGSFTASAREAATERETAGGADASSPSVDSVESPVRLDGLRVLVVDDEADARRLVEKVLADVGASITVAASVREAMAALEKEKPQVLVSDLAMSDEDGFDLIQQLRSSGHAVQQLPAVALTAYAHKSYARSALLAGFQAHVAKPVDSMELIAVIASLAGRTGQAPAAALR